MSGEVEVIVEDGQTPCEPVASHTSLDMGFSHFNPLQSRFVLERLHTRDVNILSAWPTSTGKTVVAELTMEVALSKGKKAIYACPLKSLAEEKIRRFKGLFPERRLEIFTGDYREVENRTQKAALAEIAVVTTELLDSASRRVELSEALIGNAGVVIVDEAHILATERGPAVESALVKITKINPDIRLVLLSATVGNTKEIARWLCELNGKDTVILESSWRPVKIEWHLKKDSNSASRSYFAWRNRAIVSAAQKIAELVFQDEEAQILVFVWTKMEGILLARELESMDIPCLFHNASLELKERLDFEEKFEKREIRVLISTTTLAWGRNTCARHVVIFGDRRGPEKVPSWDVLQMGGRAGRTGLAPKGDVWWFVYDVKYARSVIQTQPKIESLLKNPRKLAFALVGEFPYRGRANIDEIREWFLRTLAGKSCSPETANLLLKEAIRILKEDTKAITDDFSLTHIGRAAKLFYLDPYEVKALEGAIKIAVECIPDLVKKITSDHTPALAILMARVEGMENIYVSNTEKEKINEECRLFKKKVMPFVEIGLVRDYFHYAAILLSLKWLEEMKQYLVFLAEEAGKRPYPHYKVRDLIWDIDRIGSAACFLARQMGLNELGEVLADASMVIKYGAPPEARDLLKIKGIGAVRAVRLLKAGIRTRKDLKKTIESGNGKIWELIPQNVLAEVA